MASTLTLVDVSLTPEQAYIVLEALYETEGLFKPEDTKDVIDYIENRMIDAELPLSIEEYQDEVKSPEDNTWKSVSIFHTPKEN